MLYRVFPFQPHTAPTEPGGPFHVPRHQQGAGRHDNPDPYGALYVSRTAISAVAERIQAFRGQTLSDTDLRHVDGRADALATIDDGQLEDLLDLDNPRILAARDLRPSRIATRNRSVTQPLAAEVFDDGWAGFEWWSTLEASWTNATLFAERAVHHLSLSTQPDILTVRHPVVIEAADALGLRLAV